MCTGLKKVCQCTGNKKEYETDVEGGAHWKWVQERVVVELYKIWILDGIRLNCVLNFNESFMKETMVRSIDTYSLYGFWHPNYKSNLNGDFCKKFQLDFS